MKMILSLAFMLAVSANQGILNTQQEKIHPMTQAIVGLAELASQTHDFDFSQLFVALDELAQSFQERKTEENGVYEKEFNSYVADQQFYSNQITEYQNQVALLEVELKDITDLRARSQEFLKEKRAEVFDTQKLLASKTSEIQQDQSAFNKLNNDYSEAIRVLDEAITLLGTVKDEQSLIQKSDNFKQVGNRMHSHFKQMKSKRVFYQPLVKSLLALAQQNYVDQDNLNKVTKFMEDLRASLISDQTALTNEFNSQKAQQATIQSEIQAKLNELNQIVIPNVQSEISTKDGEIAALKGILNDANNNLKDAKDSLAATENRWIVRTSSHKALIQQYENELLVIKDAENSLKKGGIFRQ